MSSASAPASSMELLLQAIPFASEAKNTMKAIESLTNYLKYFKEKVAEKYPTTSPDNPPMMILLGFALEHRNNEVQEYMNIYSPHVDPDQIQGVWMVSAVRNLLMMKGDALFPCFVHFTETQTKDGQKSYYSIKTLHMSDEVGKNLPPFAQAAIRNSDDILNSRWPEEMMEEQELGVGGGCFKTTTTTPTTTTTATPFKRKRILHSLH